MINQAALVEPAHEAIFDEVLDSYAQHFGIMQCDDFLYGFQLLNGRVRLAVKFAQILVAPLGGCEVGEIEYCHDRSEDRGLIPWGEAEGHRFHQRCHHFFDDVGM